MNFLLISSQVRGQTLSAKVKDRGCDNVLPGQRYYKPRGSLIDEDGAMGKDYQQEKQNKLGENVVLLPLPSSHLFNWNKEHSAFETSELRTLFSPLSFNRRFGGILLAYCLLAGFC
jgi:hypothetical protein